MTSQLFSPFQQRSITLPNRIVMSPMAQYMAKDGVANDWHYVHYGKIAQGGVGTVMIESTATSFQGMGTYGDLGIWNDEQTQALARIAESIEGFGVVPAIQLGHAGRKGALQRAFDGYGFLSDADASRGEVPWEIVGPSAIPFADGALVPSELSEPQLSSLIEEWVDAARRAHRAGFKILEVHTAHGYLLNQFLSPIANKREDRWGGDAERRMAFPLEVIRRVREVWPEELPLWVRVSVIDDADGGRTLEDTVVFSRKLKAIGVDLVDCSSGGWRESHAKSRLVPSLGFQVPFAEAVKVTADIPTMAVGLITDGRYADEILRAGMADLVAIGRELLVDPNWALNARKTVEASGFEYWPPQYGWWLTRRQKYQPV
ncbi:NADH:flavin oxidoreductase/NADH oxidase [Pseudomonas gozinkensis]|uniref:NADH:flavin oxidoreductase/NADH oxidase n=1 Tax=Pseudomonas gozinkensis TaxID=2774461 RepID=UPI001787929B|nr:NADH:flavin oxidoreductase/NADH oxidase [Pseudomonas gozinkensis]